MTANTLALLIQFICSDPGDLGSCAIRPKCFDAAACTEEGSGGGYVSNNDFNMEDKSITMHEGSVLDNVILGEGWCVRLERPDIHVVLRHVGNLKTCEEPQS